MLIFRLFPSWTKKELPVLSIGWTIARKDGHHMLNELTTDNHSQHFWKAIRDHSFDVIVLIHLPKEGTLDKSDDKGIISMLAKV